MYLKSCCALFLLALVACQAAPSSSPLSEELIKEAEAFTNSDIKLEDTGAEKDRAKKSSTTFCVEVRSGKPEQVPCPSRQEARPQALIQQESRPVVVVQPVPVPAPMPVSIERQPIVITQPQFPLVQTVQQSQPPQVVQQQQSSQQTHVNVPPPSQPAQPQPIPQAAPAPTPIINIVPPAPAPCDRPTILQPPQPSIHTVHVIHPQLQSQPKPVVTKEPNKEQKPTIHLVQPPRIPKELLLPQQHITVMQKVPSSVFPVQSQPLNAIPLLLPYAQPNTCNHDKEKFECSCRPENRLENRIPRLTSYGRAMPNDVTFESLPYRSAMMSDSSMPNEPIYVNSEGEMEGRHRKLKQYSPLNLSVQFPVIYPSTDNSPKYYAPQYPPPVYTNSYAYPSTYGNYGNYGTYGTSYPYGTSYSNYDSQASASNIPAVTVNAGGPFYGRESLHTDSSRKEEMIPSEVLSTTTKMIDTSINQKREADMQLKEQEIIQKMKESNNEIP